MTNRDVKPGPLTADMVPLLTAGRSVLRRADGERLVVVRHLDTAQGSDGFEWELLAGKTDAPIGLGRLQLYDYIGERGDDGWISWSGGENPVPGKCVETRHRSGKEYTGKDAEMSDWWYQGPGFWIHDGTSSDIIAYRIVPTPGGEGK